MSEEAAVHPWDEGAVEPTTQAIVVAGVLGFLWVAMNSAVMPIGLLIVLFRLGTMTGANTWRGRLRFGRKALAVAAAASALGFLMHAGLFVTIHGGNVAFALRLGR